MTTLNNIAVKEIRLTGPLGKRFGKTHRFAVRSPAEAVRALCHMCKGFQQYLNESGNKGMKFAVFVDEDNITEEQLKHPSGRSTITFSPVLQGAKSGALALIAGVVLVVIGIFMLFTPFAAFAPYVIGAGIGLMAMGVAQMLAPSPKDQEKDKNEKRPNYSFDGPVNTQAQGASVGVFYGGPATIGSAVISASITTVDGVYVPVPGEGAGGGGSPWAQMMREAIADVIPPP